MANYNTCRQQRRCPPPGSQAKFAMLGAITMIMVGQCYGFYDSALAITPGIWFRKGTSAMLDTLIVSSLVFYFFFDFFNAPLPVTGSP